MQVIMLKKSKMGPVGIEAAVPDGYGRFLLKTEVAVRATKENKAIYANKISELQKAETMRLQEAKEKAEKLSQVVILLKHQSGRDGKLYGTVTSKEIAAYLSNEGITVPQQDIKIEDKIREGGIYNITLSLHHDVVCRSKIYVNVEPKDKVNDDKLSEQMNEYSEDDIAKLDLPSKKKVSDALASADEAAYDEFATSTKE